MIKTKKISTKIKFIGALLIFLITSVIATTIYLNQQNIKDALTINIAGKQRMLTQKIAKNVFYINYDSTQDFSELDKACDEFNSGLNILKNTDNNKKVLAVPTDEISNQLTLVSNLWNSFYKDVQNFKVIINSHENNEAKLKEIILSIYKNNTILLDNVDKLVAMYTKYSEDKTNFIKTFQYTSGAILFLLFAYSLMQLKSIESHVNSFMKYSKMLVKSKNISNLAPLKVGSESESEIIEVSDTINCFIKKINLAVEYSNEALNQSEKASSKLEELTDEFDTIINKLKNKSLVTKHLNNSEDIVIESTEELINSTKKLMNLKKELEKLTKSCQDLKNQKV